MNSMKQFFITSCMLIFTCLSISAYAAQQPSKAQIAQFQSLPGSQQQALAKQLGVDLNSLKSGANSTAAAQPAIIESSKPRPESSIESVNSESLFTSKGTQKQLKPFGYDIFANAPSTFNPVANIAIPSDYIIGVGDNISLQLFGKESSQYQLAVSPEGNVFVPELGQFQVAGLSFAELKRFLVDKVKERIIGVDAIVSLSELKSIRVFVLGDAYKPGAYTLSSLSSVSHALFSAGGVNDIGSLRNIQLKRAGKLVQNFDVYDLLINGDASKDVLLQSGDVVFIQPKGNTVAISGEVRRPAIYEVLNTNTMSDIVDMAGGLLPNAYKELVTIERIKDSFRTTVDIDLTKNNANKLSLFDGDVIKVRAKSQQYRDSITLIGAVTRPGKYQWQEGLKISDILSDIDQSFLPDADLLYSLVLREIDKARNIEVHHFSIAKALANKQDENNLSLKSNDKLVVFSLLENRTDEHIKLENFAHTEQDLLQRTQQLAKDKFQDRAFWNKYGKNNKEFSTEDEQVVGVFSRSRLLTPINEQLSRQSASGQPIRLVTIDGEVKYPGTYPLTKNASIKDIILAAGGVNESAYLERIDITRNTILSNEATLIETNKTYSASKQNLQFSLAKALTGDETNNIKLQSKDRLYVHKIPSWSESETIELKGEFVFPGRYTIQRGDTLKDIIARAGGFTEYAAINGSIFTREKLKKLEQDNIVKLTNNLRLEYASKSLTDDTAVAYADAQNLIRDLGQLSPIGRLVIDLEAIIDEKQDIQQNLLLEAGDVLTVPSLKNSINVIGQIQVTSSHIYQSGLTVFDYIDQSGGIKNRADDKRIYVIAANGSVKIIKQKKSWFASNNQLELKPGDTIVVPLNTDYVSNIDLWSSATDILFNTAVALAAIGGI